MTDGNRPLARGTTALAATLLALALLAICATSDARAEWGRTPNGEIRVALNQTERSTYLRREGAGNNFNDGANFVVSEGDAIGPEGFLHGLKWTTQIGGQTIQFASSQIECVGCQVWDQQGQEYLKTEEGHFEGRLRMSQVYVTSESTGCIIRGVEGGVNPGAEGVLETEPLEFRTVLRYGEKGEVEIRPTSKVNRVLLKYYLEGSGPCRGAQGAYGITLPEGLLFGTVTEPKHRSLIHELWFGKFTGTEMLSGGRPAWLEGDLQAEIHAKKENAPLWWNLESWYY
jgi:hypothetical protein